MRNDPFDGIANIEQARSILRHSAESGVDVSAEFLEAATRIFEVQGQGNPAVLANRELYDLQRESGVAPTANFTDVPVQPSPLEAPVISAAVSPNRDYSTKDEYPIELHIGSDYPTIQAFLASNDYRGCVKGDLVRFKTVDDFNLCLQVADRDSVWLLLDEMQEQSGAKFSMDLGEILNEAQRIEDAAMSRGAHHVVPGTR